MNFAFIYVFNQWVSLSFLKRAFKLKCIIIILAVKLTNKEMAWNIVNQMYRVNECTGNDVLLSYLCCDGVGWSDAFFSRLYLTGSAFLSESRGRVNLQQSSRGGAPPQPLRCHISGLYYYQDPTLLNILKIGPFPTFPDMYSLASRHKICWLFQFYISTQRASALLTLAKASKGSFVASDARPALQ